MVSVRKTRDQSKDNLLRQFSKLVLEEKIVDEVKNRMFYKSPSEIKKEKNKELLKKRKLFRNY